MVELVAGRVLRWSRSFVLRVCVATAQGGREEKDIQNEKQRVEMGQRERERGKEREGGSCTICSHPPAAHSPRPLWEDFIGINDTMWLDTRQGGLRGCSSSGMRGEGERRRGLPSMT